MHAYHAFFDPVSHHRACQDLTALVPDTHQIAIRNTKASSIFGVNSDWFTIGNRIFFTQFRIVKLTV